MQNRGDPTSLARFAERHPRLRSEVPVVHYEEDGSLSRLSEHGMNRAPQKERLEISGRDLRGNGRETRGGNHHLEKRTYVPVTWNRCTVKCRSETSGIFSRARPSSITSGIAPPMATASCG